MVGVLGAGANIVKNLLLLGNFHWPLQSNKYQTLLNQYPNNLQLQDWLSKEYFLRYWNKYYNIDLSDHLDYVAYEKNCKSVDLPIVFINHSAFYQESEFEKFSQNLDVLFVTPVSLFGLEWQIRAYVAKKTIELLHDFSFPDNKEASKKNFVEQHGLEAYYRFNVQNMKEIVDQRQKDFIKRMTPSQIFPLENLLTQSGDKLCDYFNLRFNQNIDSHNFETVLSHWRSLHWPLDQTANWEYHDLFV